MKLLLSYVAVLGSILFLTGEAVAKTLLGSRPNIIFVMTDDQGLGDLSCMGNKLLRTPHIDKFYEGATRLTDYHVSPTCAPTRAALMSGRVAFKNGVTHTVFQRERMALDTYTFPQALKSAGYTTGLFGKWHLGDEKEYLPQSRGFDEVLMHGAGGIGQTVFGDFPENKKHTYFDNVLLHNDTIVKTKGFCTDVFFNAGLAWIKEQHENRIPYFAYISLNAPHGPFIAPKKYSQRFFELGCDEKGANRLGMIENIDDNFGNMMVKLEQWNALENTIVIFTTDNGATRIGRTKEVPYFNAGMKGGKNSPYEGGTHVPFFMQWKGVLDAGVDIDGLTAHVDMYKTFTDLAGAVLPEDIQSLDGHSLVPLFEDSQADWCDRELFVHCGRWPTGKAAEYKYNGVAVRTQKWRLVNNKELYDISKDPGEKTDVAKDHPEVVAKLRVSYDQWWESTKPFWANEGLPRVEAQDYPFPILYSIQSQEGLIKEWAPAEL